LYYIPDPPFLLHAILETALTHLRGKITRNTKEKTGLRVASINSQLDQSGFRW
jgi:hypothetical protein